MKKLELKDLLEKLRQNRAVLLVLLVGLVFLLLPGIEQHEEQEPEVEETSPVFSLEREERRLETLLSGISGAGDVEVLLAAEGGVQRQLAQNGQEFLVISSGGGEESTVELSYTYPEYTGAVVVCGGADKAEVKLAVVQAVSAYTGLGSDKITVLKMK
jgi:stage III sporulation protein AG